MLNIGGLSYAQARGMAPFEIQMAVEGAHYRELRLKDEIMRAAWMVVRAWMGKKAPSFRKFLARPTADEYRERVLGREDPAKQRDRNVIKALKAKVEAEKKKGAPRG